MLYQTGCEVAIQNGVHLLCHDGFMRYGLDRTGGVPSGMVILKGRMSQSPRSVSDVEKMS